MLTSGANIGKKVDRNIMSHWAIDFMGSIFRMMLWALVWKPMSPSMKRTIFLTTPKMALGKPVMIFFPRFFILSQRLFCS